MTQGSLKEFLACAIDNGIGMSPDGEAKRCKEKKVAPFRMVRPLPRETVL
jgi:hypothetical protein